MPVTASAARLSRTVNSMLALVVLKRCPPVVKRLELI
jgi:hypothetical protein